MFSIDHDLDVLKNVRDLARINVIAGSDSSDIIYVGPDSGLYIVDKFNLKPKFNTNTLNSKT